MNKTSNSLTLLIKYLRPFWQRVLLLSVLLIGSIGLQLAGPQLIRRFLDEAQSEAAMQVLTRTAVFFFIVVLSQKIISLLSTYISEDLGWATTNQLRTDLMAHCLRLDMGFHKLHTPGELIERIDGDVSTLAEYFSNLVVQVAGNSLLVVGILILIFRESWQFGVIGLAYALLMFAFQRILREPMIQLSRGIRQSYAALFSFLEERINGTEDIRANGGEGYVMNRLYGLMAAVTNQRIKSDLLGGVSFTSSYMLYVFALVGTLALAGYRYTQGTMSIGTVYLMVFYVGLLESPLKYIRRQIENMRQAVASIERIHSFFQLQPQVREQITAVLPNKSLSVTFNDVCFAYKDRLGTSERGLSMGNGQLSIVNEELTSPQPQISNPVLENLTFQLEPGHILGILGRTGSGKTTLTRLLFRLYDVDAGSITFNGINITQIGLSDLRQHVGLVTQDVQLFAATIRDNLTLFRNYESDREPIHDDQILAAMETLGLDGWLHNLPNGLDTMLKAGGKGLSAGEAQLLAFTRVFLCDPHLVILDEASSRLDPVTEGLLERAVDRLLQHRTGIIIAHRLHTVQRADNILILENGRIVENGRRIHLETNPDSRYAQLLKTGLEEVLV